MEEQLADLERQLAECKKHAERREEELRALSINALRLEGGIIALKSAISKQSPVHLVAK